MSMDVAFSLIAHFFYYDWDDIYDLPYTFYRILLEQSLNLGALYRQGEFQLSSVKDKGSKLEQEVEAFKKFKKQREITNG